MVFDGTKESCPNYDSSGDLDQSYMRWRHVGGSAGDDPTIDTPMFQKICFSSSFTSITTI